MNERVNKLLLAGDKFIPKLHLRQYEFTYTACHLVYLTFNLPPHLVNKP